MIKKQVSLFLLTTLATLIMSSCTFLQSSNITGMGAVGSCNPDGIPKTGYLKLTRYMNSTGTEATCTTFCTATGPTSSKLDGSCDGEVLYIDAQNKNLSGGKIEYSTTSNCTGPFTLSDPSLMTVSLEPRLNQAELPLGFYAFNGALMVNNVPLLDNETEFGIFYCGASATTLYYLDLEDANSGTVPRTKTVNPGLSWSEWLQHPTIQQYSQSPTVPMLTGQIAQPELWYAMEYFTP